MKTVFVVLTPSLEAIFDNREDAIDLAETLAETYRSVEVEEITLNKPTDFMPRKIVFGQYE